MAEVLAAVIELLPARWSKIRDDRIRLRQLVNLCPSRPHLRTVGRALRHLDRLEIVRYLPACGRGATAVIAVHERFLHGIEELERDQAGSVVVPFSRPATTSLPNGKEPQHGDAVNNPIVARDPRPIEVDVTPGDLQAVLDGLPPVFADLPRNLGWLLRRELRSVLARGHQQHEILRILAAPTPECLGRPYLLAVWRLRQNMAGPGPRLIPLQRAWDRVERDRQDQLREAVLAADYRQVEAVTTAVQRQELVAAMESLVGPTADPRTAVLTAVRRARRQHPGVPAAAAVAAWLDNGDQRLTPRASEPVAHAGLSVEGLKWITDRVGACVGCGNPGVLRPELPLPTVACDSCFDQASAPLEDELAVAS